MIPEIPNIDQYIVGFIMKNPFTITLVLGLLKVCAKFTKSTKDDRVMTMLGNMFSKLNPLHSKEERHV